MEISAEEDDEVWHLTVRDNGIGIPEGKQDKIFVVFQRLHGSEAYQGTGIGLAICKRIVERHDGEIWVESMEGEGSTFHLTLAKAPSADEA